MHNLFRVLVIIWVLLVAFLSLTGSPPRVSVALLGWDKFQHAAAYAVLALLMIQAVHTDQLHLRTTILISILLAASIGVLMEICQGMMHNGREADPVDALANFLGALVAGYVYSCWQRFSHKAPAILVLVISCSLFGGLRSARASGWDPVTDDLAHVVGQLPAAAKKMVTFPANSEIGGPWWTLTALGATGALYASDSEVRQQLQDSRSPALNDLANAGSEVGNPILHVGLVAGVYAGGYLLDRAEWRQAAIKVGEALFLADSITLLAKEAVGRSRPDAGEGKGSFHPVRINGRDDSFPSMHTASSFALATVLAGETENGLIAAGYYVAATWVGVSRLIQDRHWASDVVFGAAIGGLSGWSVRTTDAERKKQTVTVLPTALPHGGGVALVGQW